MSDEDATTDQMRLTAARPKMSVSPLAIDRIFELCDAFGIADTDTLKHTLEDAARWRAELVGGLDHHHNALTCPYCNPDGLVLVKRDVLQDFKAAAEKEVAERVQALEAERDSARTREQVCFDLHTALGVAWGSDPYARIAELKAAEVALVALRDQVTQLCEQWEGMVVLADADHVIPGDEIGHQSRWTAVDMCAKELRQLLPPTEPL